MEKRSLSNKHTYRVCFCFSRRFKASVAEAPEEIKQLFEKYSVNGLMSVDNLQRFLVEIQGEKKASKEEAQEIIDRLKDFKHLNTLLRKGLSLEVFFRYLFADFNPPLSPNLGDKRLRQVVEVGMDIQLSTSNTESHLSEIVVSDGYRSEDILEKANEKTNYSTIFLAYKTLGVFFGGLVTSPLYVYPLMHLKYPDEKDYLGIYSIMFWTLTLIGVVKYCCIALKADDQGEGETSSSNSNLSNGTNLPATSDNPINTSPEPVSIPEILCSSRVHHDMKAPLSHYFIYTGHNSYLTGNQLSSDCSDVPIIKALLNGVRVIELDMWPNSKGDNVNIVHGRTLTTPVELIKCLKSIKENAFVASEYPVVITLEDHLTPNLQAKVAKMITQTFGDMLFYPESESLAQFPSPESLKKRIIISTKPPKEYKETKIGKENNPVKGKDSTDDEKWGKEVLDIKAQLEASDKSDVDAGEDHQDEEGIDEPDLTAQQIAPPEYKRLIAIRGWKPKGKLREALQVVPNNVGRLSMSEQALEKIIKNHGTEIVRFTQKNLLRIYPKGTRVDSSNYNPLIGWMHGAQMVALNMQGYGRSLWLMHGMFRANGGCGYVKKPHYMLKVGPHNEIFDPRAPSRVRKTLKVRLYMGDGWCMDFRRTHFDAYSPPDFYTRVGIAGVPADSVMMKTRTIEDDWTPIWDQEFLFPLTVPELALLRIEVHEYDMSEKDDFGGQTCLPVSELRTGIRAVPLYDYEGQKYKSVRLLMRFEFV